MLNAYQHQAMESATTTTVILNYHLATTRFSIMRIILLNINELQDIRIFEHSVFTV